jgi:hypothetical protein
VASRRPGVAPPRGSPPGGRRDAAHRRPPSQPCRPPTPATRRPARPGEGLHF